MMVIILHRQFNVRVYKYYLGNKLSTVSGLTTVDGEHQVHILEQGG